MTKISVIIITKNEAAKIRDCLESVAWADEIIVVDSNSTDSTVEICKGMGARVYSTPGWPGFGPQKNLALSYASSEWILSLDADEIVTAELGSEIKDVISNAQGNTAFCIPRLSSFCGRPMKHSGWYPDYVTRLFQRGEAEFSNDLVHEQIIAKGKVGKLKHDLLHNTFENLEQLMVKINQYSTAGAQMMHEKNKTATLKKAVGRAVWAFIRTYFLRAGFLDGREGFMVSVSTAEVTYYRYTKLMLLNERSL